MARRRRRPRRRRGSSKPPLRISEILRWADRYHDRTGQWPTRRSGVISDSPANTWGAVENALYTGGRGLPGGSSLIRLWSDHRGVRNQAYLPRLTIPQIVAWADDHQQRTGRWPIWRSGAVIASKGDNWGAIQACLQQGSRGLTGGSSVARVLFEHRGVMNQTELPRFSRHKILAWIDAHHRRTGEWPTLRLGAIEGAPGQTWRSVDNALRLGLRGLPGGSSLAEFLTRERGAPHQRALQPFTEQQVLCWANQHFARTGKWPNRHSGPITNVPGELWSTVEAALANGRRGLPGGDSLARLLQRRQGVRYPRHAPRLNVAEILRWANDHRRRTGAWPGRRSGPVVAAPAETWARIDDALQQGYRGLPGGSSLPRLLQQRRHRR